MLFTDEPYNFRFSWDFNYYFLIKSNVNVMCCAVLLLNNKLSIKLWLLFMLTPLILI